MPGPGTPPSPATDPAHRTTTTTVLSSGLREGASPMDCSRLSSSPNLYATGWDGEPVLSPPQNVFIIHADSYRAGVRTMLGALFLCSGSAVTQEHLQERTWQYNCNQLARSQSAYHITTLNLHTHTPFLRSSKRGKGSSLIDKPSSAHATSSHYN